MPAIASATSVITISGATASFPLVQLLAHKYTKLEHNKVSFRISQGGSTVGVNDVDAGRVTIADVSRDPLPTDPTGLDFYPIAEYGICIVTNKSNTLPSLNEAQIQAIFEAKDKEWSQVPGATASGPIDLISRTSTAGVLTNFKTLFLANKSVASTAAEEPSEGALEQQVANDPRGIGFLSNYRADQGTVNPVAYNGVACTRANVASGQYTATARFYEVTKGEATGAAGKFISWVRTSKAARKIISTQWVPIKATS
ncbi:MAG TPA: substrate-binding domain-containing protein [Solirubrobacteraceae bacterium]|nr:substrate-binding domain-containing protein [Solirubrobacteraceae bacterium]